MTSRSDMNLPELPDHPEPRAFKWSELEKKAMREYGKACYLQALEDAAKVCETEAADDESDVTFYLRKAAKIIRALGEKK